MDTAAKRLSALHVGQPWRGPATFPSQDLGAQRRASLAFLYGGSFEEEPTDPELEARVEELEQQVEELQQQVAELQQNGGGGGGSSVLVAGGWEPSEFARHPSLEAADRRKLQVERTNAQVLALIGAFLGSEVKNEGPL